ncbi:MAG: hypothetical protein AAF514_07050, partial [Verrucomicrobiota bacterium]
MVLLKAFPIIGAEVSLTDNISSDVTWTADNEYLIGEPIFVTNGATLTIEPGTKIYGFEDTGAGTFGSLVITRGCKIMAEGTRENPIVFTALEERDDPNGLTLEDSSLWGGLIILGEAILNDADNPVINPDAPEANTREIEGFPSGGDVGLIAYGGLNDEDDSGVLRFVSIRYGGFEFAPDEEINGLTLGAVGSGTTIEYVEVFNNSDDGVEFFGGTVNTRYMIMAFNEDESFDIDQGYRGKGQFWFSIQKNVGNGSNYGGEHDGGDSPDKTLEPFARPVVYNATYIGSGVNGGNPQENAAFRLKDNFAGQYHNSIFTDFGDYAVRIDDPSTEERITTPGDLFFGNNLWYGFGTYDGTTGSLLKNGSEAEAWVVSRNRGNEYANPYLGGISRQPFGGLDPRPLKTGPAYTTAGTDGSDSFFTQVDYKGAFSADDDWMDGWSYLSQRGYLAEPAAAAPTEVEVTENISSDTVWTNDKLYVLGKPVFVTDGATLTIEAGTTILGYEDTGAGTFGSLVVTRGSKILAEGTRSQPIRFTARDFYEDPSSVTLEDSSLWGGLIILGNAVLNDADNPVINPGAPAANTREIEGFPSGGDAGLIQYGGLDDDDDSGILRFVSISYGGFEFAPDEEINGLTLGAVGSGTTIEYVEVFNNSDDGIEFFGGTVNTKYMVMAFNEDESFDIDQGYRGHNQFWFAVQKSVGNGSNYGGEHDGGDSPDKTLEPFARTKVYNATFIGAGAGGDNPQDNWTFRLKDNFAGQYHNSVFTDYKDGAVRIDDPSTEDRAATPGDLSFENNTWFGFGTSDGSLASLTKNGSGAELSVLAADKGNAVEDPMLGGISRSTDGGLDPRPMAGSPLLGGSFSGFPEDGPLGFYDGVTYRGAFDGVDWMSGWTELSTQGFTPSSGGGEVVVSGNISSDTTWSADNEYLLGEPVFVTDGATLTIEPGTRIYGFEDEGSGTFGSIVITRDSKINAEGTKENPIVFTALEERDNPDGLTLEDSSLWGGLIILGNAVLNDADNAVINPDTPAANTREIEGFPSGGDPALIQYGGLDDDDNSGVLKYVSIRYGGFEFAPDEEINGLTLGAVGRGTTIEYVEVFNNSDDGVEFFGGTVNTKYMVMAFNEDESFDIDQGYRGKNQFWFAIQKNVGNGSNYGGEHDGGDSPDKTLEPFARSQVYNATFIGAGVGKGNPQDNAAFRLKDNFAGQYHNSIFTDFADYAVRIDDPSTEERAATDGDLSFQNNLWYDFGTYDGTLTSLTKNGSDAELHVVSPDNGNAYANPFLGGVSRRAFGGLDPRPAESGPAYLSLRSALPVGDDFYTNVNYKGAFAADDNWMDGWTYLSQKGYLAREAAAAPAEVVVTENIMEDTFWTNDKVYVIGEPIFVTNEANLTIEAGTKILGFEDADAGTFGSLVITRGSKIFAEGTREAPILFTARDAENGDLTLEDSSLWGG